MYLKIKSDGKLKKKKLHWNMVNLQGCTCSFQVYIKVNQLHISTYPLFYIFFFLFFKINFAWSIVVYSAVLDPTVQQSESVIGIHIAPLFWISFPFRSPQH